MTVTERATLDQDPLSGLLPSALPDVATDRAHREVRLPDSPPFIASARPGLALRVLELVRGAGRLAAQLAATPVETGVTAGTGEQDETGAMDEDGPPTRPTIGPLPGAELFVQRGTLTLAGQDHSAGSWLRQPLHGPQATDEITLSADALLLLSIGQIPPADTERRLLDTASAPGWLDGPSEGIEILPLHGSGAANVMLMRWTSTVAFRPTLDPVGDEVFVLKGELHDSHGSFGAGSWIRNPVAAWQSWAGTPGTLVCYKSGHFTAAPEVDVARAPR